MRIQRATHEPRFARNFRQRGKPLQQGNCFGSERRSYYVQSGSARSSWIGRLCCFVVRSTAISRHHCFRYGHISQPPNRHHISGRETLFQGVRRAYRETALRAKPHPAAIGRVAGCHTEAGGLLRIKALLGTDPVRKPSRAAKPASNSRLERRLAQTENLEPTEKHRVLQLIDAFIERGALKRKVQGKLAA